MLDPIGLIPVLVTMLDRVPPARRRRVVLRENLIALLALLLFLFFGPVVMGWFGISQGAIYIAGGIVLLLVALDMIFPRRGVFSGGGEEDVNAEPLIVPLAVPLIAGPSAMATITLLATQAPESTGTRLAALLLAWAAGLVIQLLAGRLQQILGRRVLTAAERLMGMVLVIVAVQMAMTGVESFLGSGHLRAATPNGF